MICRNGGVPGGEAWESRSHGVWEGESLVAGGGLDRSEALGEAFTEDSGFRDDWRISQNGHHQANNDLHIVVR